jgi:uncharacterized Zn-finger protein
MSFYEAAQLHAKQQREDGHPIDENTRKWIEVPEWTREQEKDEIQKFQRPDNDPNAASRLGLRVRLCGSPAAALALEHMAEHCLGELQAVAETIREGEINAAQASIAAEQLARVIGTACCQMNKLALKHPQIFIPFTRSEYWMWPVMKSTYPAFGDDEKTLLTNLEIGTKLPLRLDPKAQWARTIDDGAGRIAWQLLMYVYSARSENGPWAKSFGEFNILADKLPARPNKQSAGEWWAVALAALLTSYPEPENVEEFKRLVTAPSKRSTPGRIKQAILDVLKARFVSFVRTSRLARTPVHHCDCGNPAIKRVAGNSWICERCDTLPDLT